VYVSENAPFVGTSVLVSVRLFVPTLLPALPSAPA
jgi:hypothetical protein